MKLYPGPSLIKPEHYLKAVQTDNGVDIQVVDAAGDHKRWLAAFKDDGTLHLYVSIEGLGFQTENGHIKVVTS